MIFIALSSKLPFRTEKLQNVKYELNKYLKIRLIHNNVFMYNLIKYEIGHYLFIDPLFINFNNA